MLVLIGIGGIPPGGIMIGAGGGPSPKGALPGPPNAPGMGPVWPGAIGNTGGLGGALCSMDTANSGSTILGERKKKKLLKDLSNSAETNH
jgi:hypothetical protein